MRLTICVQNLGHGGLRNGGGDPEDRWPLLAERINSAAERVDVVPLCEVVDWHMYGHKQLARAKADLGLDALPLAPSKSGYGTALLCRPELLWEAIFLPARAARVPMRELAGVNRKM
ncbi:hypothetical protein ABIA33_004959 [Streptacidiphilus sp. MAP12-16]|uniref:hypothetical protein n=1 Tax=Streptacidiphilus sp. MAP12-16 TaxID=3156300 RepID=UPI0035186BEA